MFLQLKQTPSTAGLLVILFTSILLKSGLSIPTTQSRICSPPEPLIFDHGSTVELECGSYCSSPANDDSTLQFKWSKKVLAGDSVVDLGTTTGPVYSIPNALFRDGGQYKCECAEGGKECSYNVSVVPVMSFKASDTYIHDGDTFDLSCILSGFPSNFTRISANTTGEQMPNQMQKRVNESSTRSYVPVFKPVGEVYVCEAESYFAGQLVAHLRKEVTVHIYNPPSIIYTTEYIISSESDFGKPAHLGCTIQMSPDTTSYVTWFVKGEEIGNSTKYTTMTLGTEDEDIMKYKLVVSDVQEDDIGSYLCRVSSVYGVEDVQEAWIQVDYRKNSEAIGTQGSTHSHGTESGKYGSSTSGQTNILFFAFCGLFVLVAMVFLWRMAQSQKMSPRKAHHSNVPIIQYHHGDSMESLTTPTDGGRSFRKHC